MKRHGNLWPQIISFENLVAAARQAQRGKRFRDNIVRFNYHLEKELIRLQTELESGTYQPGPYKTCEIVVPKKRMISAAPYRDRIVHHALCNIIAPIFERTYIRDSYANRVGYGTHRALQRFTTFCRTHRYVLQCDIQKYFPSIDHELLKAVLRRKIKCPQTLWLIDTIINASNPQEPVLMYFPGDDLLTPLQRRRGLPIGNLTSQFFANVYLNGLDHFVKEDLRTACYLRYVDDFALFSQDRAYLQEARTAIEAYLAMQRLKIHPIKSQLFETLRGATFVGFRVLPDRIRVRQDNLRRARRRLRSLQAGYREGRISLERLNGSMQSWVAHLAHADTWHLRERLFGEFPFVRDVRE